MHHIIKHTLSVHTQIHVYAYETHKIMFSFETKYMKIVGTKRDMSSLIFFVFLKTKIHSKIILEIYLFL